MGKFVKVVISNEIASNRESLLLRAIPFKETTITHDRFVLISKCSIFLLSILVPYPYGGLASRALICWRSWGVSTTVQFSQGSALPSGIFRHRSSLLFALSRIFIYQTNQWFFTYVGGGTAQVAVTAALPIAEQLSIEGSTFSREITAT